MKGFWGSVLIGLAGSFQGFVERYGRGGWG